MGTMPAGLEYLHAVPQQTPLHIKEELCTMDNFIYLSGMGGSPGVGGCTTQWSSHFGHICTPSNRRVLSGPHRYSHEMFWS